MVRLDNPEFREKMYKVLYSLHKTILAEHFPRATFDPLFKDAYWKIGNAEKEEIIKAITKIMSRIDEFR